MLKLTITVTGAGGTIATEMALIYEALTAAGCEVKIVDDYPPTVYPLSEECLNWVERTKRKVELRANHTPWGG
jgi:hypothetical protein